MVNLREIGNAPLASPMVFRDRFAALSSPSYYRARYYDPSAGRFLSEDPIEFAGGVNFYRYISNNSTNFRDPLGLCPPKDPCQIPLRPWHASVDINIIKSMAAGPAFQFLMVLPHMPWDYKQQNPTYDDFWEFQLWGDRCRIGVS